MLDPKSERRITGDEVWCFMLDPESERSVRGDEV
jgi:hypothetical protein